MNIIKTDMAKAKEIHRNNIRVARSSKFKEQDIAFQRALETGADTSSIVATKKKLRDAPDDERIDIATSETDLKAQWDLDLLGNSPYTT
tara:strand:- start:64 stop:330 length:267 start_codon:yes stop_codon:yes gene_type:complete